MGFAKFKKKKNFGQGYCPYTKFLQLNCYLSAANRTRIENLLPSPQRDGFGGQHRHRCDYFSKPSLPIILRFFLRQPIIANDYFTIITIIGPRINRSDASLKSTTATRVQHFDVKTTVVVYIMVAKRLCCVSNVMVGVGNTDRYTAISR